jgi:hypothetical protein
MQHEEDEVYTEWLAAAPKGVRWDKAQEMYQLYQERRREQAENVAKRLMGSPIVPKDRASFDSVETAIREAERLGLIPSSR